MMKCGCSIVLLLIAILTCLDASKSYKIAIFAPDISNSQLIWNVRVAEHLLAAGHNVTLIRIKATNKQKPAVAINPGIRISWANGVPPVDNWLKREEAHNAIVFKHINFWDGDVRKALNMFMQILDDTCETLIKQTEYMNWLREEKFDLAFSHMYDLCVIGIIHHVRIPTWIWLNSGALMDPVAVALGVPSPPSYVPPMMMDASGDNMPFTQRLKSFLGHTIFSLVYSRLMVNPQTKIFRKQFGSDFPNLLDLARKAPLTMVNSNELYDIPRPTLHKVVNIGGLGMKTVDVKPLKEPFASIVNKAESVIVMSFGSVANASEMPKEWKTSFMVAFKHFPEHQFIVRYDIDDLKEAKPDNVHLEKWLPQVDLLQHPKTKVFISHGGYNSLQEAIHSTTPIITIPLFGDQFRNARIAEKHGFGYYLPKTEITEASIVKALKTVLNDNRYTQSVVKMQKMVAAKPIRPEQLLVRWTEFLAEFQELPNLVPAGTQLSFIQYFCLDVIAVLLFVILVVLYFVYKILMFAIFMLKKCCCGGKKKQKKA